MGETAPRNLILALVLSALVLLGWPLLVDLVYPRQASETATPPAAGPASVEGPALPDAAEVPMPAAAVTLGEALVAAPRVRIETPSLQGSINLVGARIDDLVLLDHRTRLGADAPPVRLFSPARAPGAYFAGFGWAGAQAPPPGARWQADGPVLAPGRPVTLTWTSPAGLRFQQRIAVDEHYLFEVRQSVANLGSTPVALRPFGFVQRAGTGPDRSTFNLHVGPLGVVNGQLREREVGFGRLRDRGEQRFRSDGGWLGITDTYWLAALIPDQRRAVDMRFAAVPPATAGGPERFQTDYLAPAILVEPGRQAEAVSHLFAGAKEVALVNAVRDQLGVPLFDRSIAWGWFWFLAQPIFFVLDWLFRLTGNFGLAIIGLTLFVRLLLFPIANRQYASMAKLRVFAPKMKELQERYKDDKVKLQQEMMALYKREKINPLAGCLPILLQIPIFYALYKTLLISVEMRHQPLAGWIRDLSAPDPLTPVNLFGLLPFQPPSFLAIGVLPILLGITMWIQFKLNPQPMDEIQKKIFGWMPWIFMFFMAPFAAGLQLYWTVNNIVSIAQQYVLIRRYPAPAPATPAPAPAPTPAPRSPAETPAHGPAETPGRARPAERAMPVKVRPKGASRRGRRR